MKPIALLDPDHIVVPLPGPTLQAALDALIERLDQSGSLRDRASLEEGISASPNRATVVVSHDVVLPHFRTDAVTGLVVALGVAPEPLAIGEHRVRIVALVLAPTESATAYLRAVSALARVFRQETVVERLLSAGSAADVMAMSELAALSVQPHLVVGDVMTREISPVSPDMSVRDIVARLARTGLRALPVTGPKGEVLGIVGEGDVLDSMLQARPRTRDPETGGLLPPLSVRDVMTRSVMCIAENTDLEEAARLMVSKDLDMFPVVTEGRLSGVISRSEILNQLYGR